MLDQLVNSLPEPRTSLIGREHEVEEVRRYLLHGPERLVTLTGVGGCGKTRLALQVAQDLREAFPHGIGLAELARISDPLLVPEAVAAALGVQTEPNQPLLDTLTASLQPRALLLVLDNCEHLIDACAELADRLLSACPDLRILATSREPLQIAGERQRRVPPLPVPEPSQIASPEELAHCPAVRLFVERAVAVEPSFRLTTENAAAVARVCTLLDGIPLALELAAARVRVLSATQIAQRLDDCFRLLGGGSRSAPSRQQTLKATLDWSYNLLSADEQAAFRRLAVLVGGWGLEAAEAVCQGGEPLRMDVLEVLTRLVDKSLVLAEEQEGEARYRLLEPVRQYARQRLQESDEVEAAQARYAAFCIDLAERAEPQLYGPREGEWLRRLDRELDGIRAVMGRAVEREERQVVLRLAGALYWYFWMRRHLREGQRWLESALAGGEGLPARIHARGLAAMAVVCSFLGEYPKGKGYGQAALALYRQVDDPGGLAMATITLSHITLGLGDLPGARALAEEAVVLGRSYGSKWYLGQALVVLGQVVHQQGDTARAIALHEEAIVAHREQGDVWGTKFALTNLAFLQQNQPDIIRTTAIASVNLLWEERNYPSLAAALEYLAARGERGRPEAQVRLFAAAYALRKKLGIQPSAGERDDIDLYLAAAKLALGAARFASIWDEGCAASLEQVVGGMPASEQPAGGPAAPKPVSRSRAFGLSDALTPREREVARLLARGYTDRQIAAELTITEGTAGLHVHHILEKLGLRSRVQLVDWMPAQGQSSGQKD